MNGIFEVFTNGYNNGVATITNSHPPTIAAQIAATTVITRIVSTALFKAGSSTATTAAIASGIALSALKRTITMSTKEENLLNQGNNVQYQGKTFTIKSQNLVGFSKENISQPTKEEGTTSSETYRLTFNDGTSTTNVPSKNVISLEGDTYNLSSEDGTCIYGVKKESLSFNPSNLKEKTIEILKDPSVVSGLIGTLAGTALTTLLYSGNNALIGATVGCTAIAAIGRQVYKKGLPEGFPNIKFPSAPKKFTQE